MSTAVNILGSLLIMIWFAVTSMGNNLDSLIPAPFSNDLLRYKWLILGLGIFLTIAGFVTKVRKHKEKWINVKQASDLITRKNFTAEQQKHKALETIDTLDGKLKDIAMKVDWSPLSGGGANFKTHKLNFVNSMRVEVLKSTGGKLFGGLFILMGTGIPAFISYTMYQEGKTGWELLIPVLVGAIFSIIGIALLFFPKPRVFDKRLGWFWAGSKSLQREQQFMQLKKSARLAEIAALQIIPERITGRKSGSYTSWEINLVSEDAQRLNVLDHGDRNSIIEDAQKLGEFLDVPVWENT